MWWPRPGSRSPATGAFPTASALLGQRRVLARSAAALPQQLLRGSHRARRLLLRSPHQRGEQRPQTHLGQGAAQRSKALPQHGRQYLRGDAHSVGKGPDEVLGDAALLHLRANQPQQECRPLLARHLLEERPASLVQVHRPLRVLAVAVGAIGSVGASAGGEEDAGTGAELGVADAAGGHEAGRGCAAGVAARETRTRRPTESFGRNLSNGGAG
eukprot:CAMPEP_0176311746 /NCGR_PEP_ID=MMETSP0121_2-20121125/66307_1 /TAXON_ID=160619 /ORGANISM="Kryptoperidinium foliaceum, Strain CCMP 1326" /LENGTH=213 /DNA_ID=CAMNT_0017653797 /DNA_START=38 /DNA_END=675 /DNA_ORIENTATION=-